MIRWIDPEDPGDWFPDACLFLMSLMVVICAHIVAFGSGWL